MDKEFTYTDSEFRDLLDGTYAHLDRYIRKVYPDLSPYSEDIIQDALLRILDNAPSVSRDNMPKYLFSAVRNACRNHITRKFKKTVPIESITSSAWETLYNAEYGVSGKPYSIPDISAILSSARDLPDKTREIFMQSRIEGRKRKDIAAEMNMSERNVQKHLSKSERFLRGVFTKKAE